MKTLNYSRQRQAILDFLSSRKDHPTADVIYQNVRDVLPNISLGTVYRNLKLLADMGSIRRVRGIDDTEHFDADTSDHQHFICRTCGEVEDIYLDSDQLMSILNSAAVSNFAGTITSDDIYFYGYCKDCTQQKMS